MWRNKVGDTVPWSWNKDWIIRQTHQTSISQSVLVFYVIGQHDDVVYGHWFVPQKTGRSDRTEVCWKRPLMRLEKRQSPGCSFKASSVPPPLLVDGKLLDEHHIFGFDTSLLSKVYSLCPPFCLNPLYSQRDKKIPYFCIPINVVVYLRIVWGEDLVKYMFGL